MDIITAHQHGLIEQLEADAWSLAGRACDHSQRAIVLYHLFDHSSGAHEWALAEAAREIHLASAVSQLLAWPERWCWTSSSRTNARQAIAGLVELVGAASRERCAAAYRAYRMTAVAALTGEAERSLSPELFDALSRCHQSRRAGEPLAEEDRQSLFAASERLAASCLSGHDLAGALARGGNSRAGRIARKLLGPGAMERFANRASRRAYAKMERMLKRCPMLPAAFRANPAQHFFALQYGLAQRRRKDLRDHCDLEAGAFELAA